MKITFSARRHPCVARAVIFLTMVALIAGMVGCVATPTPAPQYDLTITSAAGGQVTTPGEGTFTYDEGDVVNLLAARDVGYQFVSWTGDVDTITDVNGSPTTITMNDHYSITANFEEAPPFQYNLTVSSTAGGSVTAPGEGTFTYDEGTTVDLAVEAAEGYRFTRWSGDAGTIANTSAASTIIAMDGDYAVVANFEEVDPGTLFAGGSGTPGDPYQIANWRHLHNARDYPNKHFLLMRDLNRTAAGYAQLASAAANQGMGWQPIGTNWDDRFTGAFDGQGYEIRDLFINRPEDTDPYDTYEGLLGCVGDEGVIQNTGVVNIDVTGNWVVGGLVGWNRGTVNNCYSTGSVTGHGSYAGGLVGFNAGTVNDSYSSGSVISEAYIGGLVGANHNGTVSNSYSTCTVTGSHCVIGGLVGSNGWRGTVSNSYYNYDKVLINGENIITIGALFDEDFDQWLANDKFLDVNERLSQEDGYYVINDVGDFKQLLAFGQDDSLRFRLEDDLDLASEAGFYVPYLAGEFNGSGHRISNMSFSFHCGSQVGLFGYLACSGKVSELGVEKASITIDQTVGGLVGWNDGTVNDSYAIGRMTGYKEVGGLVGRNDGNVSNSYSNGSVTSEGYDIGGLVGINYGTVGNSYSSCTVAGDWKIGGLVGWNPGTVLNSFWDTQTSGQVTSDGGTGKTTTEMKNIATLSDAGWNIIAVGNPGTRNPSYIWNIVDGQTYPFLSWQSVVYVTGG